MKSSPSSNEPPTPSRQPPPMEAASDKKGRTPLPDSPPRRRTLEYLGEIERTDGPDRVDLHRRAVEEDERSGEMDEEKQQ